VNVPFRIRNAYTRSSRILALASGRAEQSGEIRLNGLRAKIYKILALFLKLSEIMLIFEASVIDMSLCTFRAKNVRSGYPSRILRGVRLYRYCPFYREPSFSDSSLFLSVLQHEVPDVDWLRVIGWAASLAAFIQTK
jgi:hypothetical protein